MIITQTPLRISFAGGGTDFADFYTREEGRIVSSAIDKYIYVIVKERFDEKIRVGYSRTEMVDCIDDIEHELVRESLRKVGIEKGIEISTMADVPSEGSGLGSSSTVTVGLLNALYAYKGEIKPAEVLAREACEIEIDVLGKPIGKQDQYIAAYGGVRYFRFMRDGSVIVAPVEMDSVRRRQLDDSLLLFYTGITRQSSSVLSEQKENISDRMAALVKMRDQADSVHACLSDSKINRLGQILRAGWELKKSLATSISNDYINKLYEKALKAGATGGKVAGAGGGGFLLLFCPPAHQHKVRKALADLKELPFRLDRDGTKVIFNVKR
ncbi:MAG: GHMP kinase [Armatimonadetes bacterium]|nr:GHMP kinase [Armatimonadota bacterium]